MRTTRFVLCIGVAVVACRGAAYTPVTPAPTAPDTATRAAVTPVIPAPGATQTQPAPASTSPWSALVGTWELVSTRMTRNDSLLFEASAPAIRAIKILNGTDYSVVTIRGGQFMRAGTGRYTVAGSTYTETIDLASGRFTPGRSYAFTFDLTGDVWTIDGGQGQELFHEVWRRVR